MKVKTPSQTAGPLTGKQYGWVGHFKNHLNAGHNDGPNIYQREPGNSLTPVLDVDKDFAVYGADVGKSFRIDKNTELGVSASAVMGRGRGQFKGMDMPTDWRVGAQFKRRF